MSAYIDSHVHLNTLTWSNLDEMRMAGIETIVSPVHLDAAKPVSHDTIVEMWDYLIDVHFPRAEQHLIKPFGMIGISMVSTPKDDPAGLYSLFQDYLKRPDVVAVGEIGIEPNSRTCKDIEKQKEFVRGQLDATRGLDVCVDFHVPNVPEDKKKYTEITLQICREMDFPHVQGHHRSLLGRQHRNGIGSRSKRSHYRPALPKRNAGAGGRYRDEAWFRPYHDRQRLQQSALGSPGCAENGHGPAEKRCP